MYRLARIYKVEVGHRLAMHGGKCKNLHGHNYRIEVGIKSPTINSHGMVMDFTELKNLVAPVLDKFDHALMLNCLEDPELIEYLEKEGMKILPFPGDPTAEMMCEWMFYQVKKVLMNYIEKDSTIDTIELEYVKIWETDNSCAEYRLN